MTVEYTKEQLDEFRTLVEMTESIDQMTRIQGRLDLMRFVRDNDKELCDAMFAEIKDE